MRRSILIVSMLILILLAAPIAAVRQVAANSTPITASVQAEKGNDDTLYLRRFEYNNLTTAKPSEEKAENITVQVKSTTVKRWVNETTVPNTWIISRGSYNFTFWISSSKDQGVHANVSFTFGYITPEGRESAIASGFARIINVGNSIISRNITTPPVESQTIGSGSKLFIKVTISASGSSGDYIYFYYDGQAQPTQIITPQISSVVPEFPFGAVFLPPVLLSAYFILKRRTIKFRA